MKYIHSIFYLRLGCSIFILFMITSYSLSQFNVTEMNENLMTLDWEIAKDKKFNSRGFLEDTEGSPYIDDKYKDGRVYIYGNPNPWNVSMRLNNYLDEVEIRSGDSVLVFGNKRLVEKIEIEDKKYRVFPYKKNNSMVHGFYCEIDSGAISFFSRTEILYEPEKKPEVGYEEFKPAEFVKQSTKFYVKFGEELPIELPGSKGKMIKFFEKEGFEIGGFCKENKIKVNESSLIKLSQHLNKQ